MATEYSGKKFKKSGGNYPNQKGEAINPEYSFCLKS